MDENFPNNQKNSGIGNFSSKAYNFFRGNMNKTTLHDEYTCVKKGHFSNHSKPHELPWQLISVTMLTQNCYYSKLNWVSVGGEYQYACSCTPATARPLGSFMFFHAASHSSAFAVEHATLASWGTLRAALSLGKCSSNILR